MESYTRSFSGIIILIAVSFCYGETYKGINFPNGPVSFADEVILYDPLFSGGPGPTLGNIPSKALGIPDYVSSNRLYATLGRGGKIELLFSNNLLVNSGSDGHDLHIFEVGPDVEDTFVAIRPTAATAALLGEGHDADADGYYEIGKVFGATSSIDIDAIYPGFAAGELEFDAVQLIDDYNEGGSTGATVGADIDAVGAIGSVRLCNYFIIGDLNYDCAVNLEDIALMASNWLVDCKVDNSDPACILIE